MTKNNQAETSQTKANTLQAKLSWLPQKTFELEIEVSKETVTKTYEKVLKKVVANAEIKGFRKGKAPQKLVEEQIGTDRLYEDVIQDVVSVAYRDAVNHHHLRPLINPQIIPLSMEKNQNWRIKAISCEEPDVKLGSYKEEIRGIKAKSAIWTPDKEAKGTEEKRDEQQRLEEIFQILLKTTTIELSDLLVEKEVNRLMSTLLDQVNALGMSIQQYLETKGTTQEKLRTNYRKVAQDSLKLDFILPKVADAEKIIVGDSEVNELIAKTKDEKTKKQMQEPTQKYYLMYMLRKQKTVDFLQSL